MTIDELFSDMAFVRFGPAMMTLQFFFARILAVALPMPELPPHTSATLSVKSTTHGC